MPLQLKDVEILTAEHLDGYVLGLKMKLWKDNTFQIEKEQKN